MKKPAYGYCPTCSFPGSTRERSPNGNTTCENGHVYKSRDSLDEPRELTLNETLKACGFTKQPALDGGVGTFEILHKNGQIAFTGDAVQTWTWLRTRAKNAAGG